MADPLLSFLLEEGFTWKLKIKGRTFWAQAASPAPEVVRLNISPADSWELGEDLPMIGSEIEAEVVHDTGIYQLVLSVLDIQEVEGWVELTAGVSRDFTRIQRREAFRVKLLLDAKMRLGIDFAETYEALVRDLSETGIHISLHARPSSLQRDATVLIVFFASLLGSMSVKGRVRWLSPRNAGLEAGINFVDLSPEDTARLRRYLWQVQKERFSQEAE